MMLNFKQEKETQGETMIQVTSTAGVRLILTNSPKEAKRVHASNPGSKLDVVEDY